MSHFLNASELAEACHDLGLEDERRALELAAQRAGDAIAQSLHIKATVDAKTEAGFGGLCVGFGPAFEGQDIPLEIRGYDDGSEWSRGELDE